MSQDIDSPLVPIKPRHAFTKNTPNRASFCGVISSPTSTYGINRKSWCYGIEPDYMTISEIPELGTFKGNNGTFKGNNGTFPRKSKAGVRGGVFTPTGNEVRRFSGNVDARRYGELSQRSSTVSEVEPSRPAPSSESEGLADDRSTEDDERFLLGRPNRNGGDCVDGVRKPFGAEMKYLLPIDADENGLDQSRESLSSGGDRGDCSSSPETSNSCDNIPGEISIQERYLRTHPIWFLPGVHRTGAFNLLHGKEEGSFIVRQSSQPETLAISVRLPRDKGPYIEHYLIQKDQNDKLSLETSQNTFGSIAELIVHYAQCCDELPVQLKLPRKLRNCTTRKQLDTIALLGKEYWKHQDSIPSPTIDSRTSRSNRSLDLETSSSSNERMSSFKLTAPKPALRPNTLSLATTVHTTPPPPPPRRIAPAPPMPTPLENNDSEGLIKHQSLAMRLSPECEQTIAKSLASLHNSFKHLPVESPDLIGSNSITSGVFSPSSQISNSLMSKGCFSPESQLCSPLSSSGVFSPISDSICSPISANVVFAGNTSRSRRTKKHTKKENPYQEIDTPNSPDVYCRSSLQDKISDYEDIWQQEKESPYPCSTFKPNGSDDSCGSRTLLTPVGSDKNSENLSCTSNDSRSGIMLSRRPDLLPDTLPKLIGSKSDQSLPEKEPLISKSNESISEVIRRMNSKADVAPKRPNKLELKYESSQVICEETVIKTTPPKHNKPTSPFYSEPIDALVKGNTNRGVVHRRKLIRTGLNLMTHRYSEPPTQPYKPLQDLYGSQNIGPPSPTESGSTDNLLPSDRIECDEAPFSTNITKQKWKVDSSWEFIDKQEENAFPSDDETPEPLTLHRLLVNRYPELEASSSARRSPRASCYDNVPGRFLESVNSRDELESDDGTVFSEPWDSSKWDKIVPNIEVNDFEGRLKRSPLFNGTGTLTRHKSLKMHSSGPAGKAVKEYAMKLASDQSTTFARHIQNFIVCTLSSKEKCPEIMMRNMRQFMSGMKNYLVKHGEKEFSKEVERERQKLKPTEFLNLDAILEEVMVRSVIRPLKKRLYTLLVDSTARPACAWSISPEHFDLESSMIPPEETMRIIARNFLFMQESDSPLEKLNLLVNILDSIANSTSSNAENMARVLAWCAHDCGADVALALEARVLVLAPSSYLSQPRVASALATLHRAAALLHTTDRQSVVVIWPDESDGRLVALRPQCGPETNRVIPLARAAAAHAGVHNTSNYALYLLERRNGQIHETMLQDNDDIDDVMTGKRCILAYKRIDSKIAWPHDVFDLARCDDLSFENRIT